MGLYFGWHVSLLCRLILGIAVNFLETPLPVAEHKTSRGVVKFRLAELADIDRLSLLFLVPILSLMMPQRQAKNI
jgi:hypothetical protein